MSVNVVNQIHSCDFIYPREIICSCNKTVTTAINITWLNKWLLKKGANVNVIMNVCCVPLVMMSNLFIVVFLAYVTNKVRF